MTTLKFVLRRSSRGSSHSGSLCLRFIHERKVKVITTDIKLYPHEWDDASQSIRFEEKHAERYTYLCRMEQTLDSYYQEFQQIIVRLRASGRYSLEDIIGTHRSIHCSDQLSGFIELQCRELLRLGQSRTARAYRTAGRALIRFNKGRDLALKEINKYLIKEFETYLKGCGKAMNTISYYMRMLRAIYWKAVRRDLIHAKRENPFAGVFTGFEQTRKRALDCTKLRELNNLDFSSLLDRSAQRSHSHSCISRPDKGLYDSWRYFFFCFHARGMSFVDLAYLRKENIRQGVISYYRKKTNQKLEITLSPMLRRIIDSFSDEVRFSPYVFPVIRDLNKSSRIQYENGLRLQNLRLKQLACLAGIDTPLTTHVARHSWATLGKRQNLSLSIISEGLGHSSEKTTYTYLASFDRSALDKASESISRAVINGSSRRLLSLTPL